jgi:hypothetical protein
MSELLPTPEPETNLYGEPKSEVVPPTPPGQGVWDQLLGLFTEPSEVFRRLRQSPTWVGAFVLTIVIGLFASLSWAAKVDMEAAAKRKFEVMERAFHMNIPQEAMDKALDQAATQGKPFLQSSLGIVLGVPVALVILAAILFAFVKFGGEDEDVTFGHAWAATTVHGLTMMPISLLAGIMCLLKPVGGAASYASLAPTSLNFWMSVENPWIRGLLAVFDPFYLFSFVALFLAAKHTLRLKPWANALLMGITGFFGFLFHFIGGIF